MNHYELAYVLDPDLPQEELSATSEAFTSLITDNGGAITATASLGKRRLAYEIGKKREGTYFFVQFESDGGLLPELNRQMKLSDRVMRHMVVKLDERYLEQAALPAEQPAPAAERVPVPEAARPEAEAEAAADEGGEAEAEAEPEPAADKAEPVQPQAEPDEGESQPADEPEAEAEPKAGEAEEVEGKPDQPEGGTAQPEGAADDTASGESGDKA